MARKWQRPILGLGLGLTAALAGLSSARCGFLFAAAPLPPPSKAPKGLSVTAAVAGEPVALPDEGAPAGGSASTLAGLALAAALVLSAASRARGSRQTGLSARQAGVIATIPREVMEKLGRYKGWSGEYKDLPFTFHPGTHGYSWKTRAYRPPPKPCRMCLSKITEPKAKFKPSDFYKASFAGLKAADIKQASSYMIQNGEYVQGATFPTYVAPKTNTWLEKEKGDKRPAQDDKGYDEYVTKKSSLVEVAPKQGVSMDKDFVVDSSALTLLLSYVSEMFTQKMLNAGQGDNPMDLVKVSKVPGGKGLYIERVFDLKIVSAEYSREYAGAWSRSEVSNHGNFFPAFYRACTGDRTTTHMSITGYKQIAGSRAGRPDNTFRFVEYSMGGFDFLVRTKSHMVSDGKNVEIQTKNMYFRQETSMFKMYTKMLLSGTDMVALGLQKSGRLSLIKELTPEGLESPELVEAVERRFGRLVALLGKVKEAMADAAEGEEYVLQWQKGELVFGKYEMPAAEKKEKETA